MNCNCGSIQVTGSGGLVHSGSADVSIDQVSGGVSLGGTADVDLLRDPLDGLIGCWTLGEDASPYLDRTKRLRHALSVVEPTQDTGVYCLDSQRFQEVNNTGPIVTVPNLPTKEWSISCWVLVDNIFRQRSILSLDWLQISHSILNHIIVTLVTADGNQDVFSVAQLEQGRWYHIAVTYSNNIISIYVNGVLNKSSTVLTPVTNTTIGHFGRHKNGSYLTGNLQEVRHFPEAREANWFVTERLNYCGGMVVVGGEETSVLS